jgi:hypothetical protein
VHLLTTSGRSVRYGTMVSISFSITFTSPSYSLAVPSTLFPSDVIEYHMLRIAEGEFKTQSISKSLPASSASGKQGHPSPIPNPNPELYSALLKYGLPVLYIIRTDAKKSTKKVRKKYEKSTKKVRMTECSKETNVEIVM